jgi:hypothetical protein
MKKCAAILFAMLIAAPQVHSAETRKWYAGDERCPPPKDDGMYSAPYNALDYPHDYPTFPESDKHGWSCSYSKEDGVIVQYGDSRTPQQQWLAIYGDPYNQ